MLDGDLWPKALILLFLICVNAFFAVTEMAIVSMRQSKLKFLMNEGDESALIVSTLMEVPCKLLDTIHLWTTFTGFLIGAMGAQTMSYRLSLYLKDLWTDFPASLAYWLSTVFITFFNFNIWRIYS